MTKIIKQHVVHMAGEEGAITVATNGLVTTSVDARPGWARLLAVANIAEHEKHYRDRLGPTYSLPELILAGDLSWTAINDEGEIEEIEADSETRNTRLGLLLGVDVTDFAQFGKPMDGALVEVYVSADRDRTPEEASTLEHASTTKFDRIAATG